MDLIKIHREIRENLAAQADPALVQKYARYFKEGYDAYGLAQGVLQEQKRALLEAYRDELGMPGFLDLGDLLVDGGKYEEVMLAIIMVPAFARDFDRGILKRTGAWLDEGIQNWAQSDTLCSEILAILWKKHLIGVEDLLDWRGASVKWKRRAVPVTLINAMKNGTEVTAILEFIDPMMMDEERVVHQGLGWLLREAWKREPEPVEAFLVHWKNDAARLIFQYATEKMDKDERVKYRRDKKR